MIDLSQRSGETEQMDDLQCKGEVIEQTLHELEMINQLLGGNQLTMSGISELVDTVPSITHLRVFDLGCGRGDMLELISNWAKSKGIRVQLTGIDANPNIIKIAQARHENNRDIRFEVKNIFDPDLARVKPDIILATLFTHHFTDDQLSFLLRQWNMQASIGIVINDLHRHWLAYHSISLLTHYFSKSGMVKNDGPVSVSRAFSKNEWKHILENAGISHYKITWHWAFRWKLVIYSK